MSRMLHRLLVDDSGQDLIEYALLTSLLTIVSITAVRLVGVRVSRIWFLVGRAL